MAEKSQVKAMQKALESDDYFLSWQGAIAIMKEQDLAIEKRMQHALRGMNLGVLPDTAITACGVSSKEFDIWIKSPENYKRLQMATASCDARLEATIYEAAKIDPHLAYSLLDKKNPKRWAQEGVNEEGEKTKTAITKMSKMLESDDTYFDVATDVKTTRDS